MYIINHIFDCICHLLHHSTHIASNLPEEVLEMRIHIILGYFFLSQRDTVYLISHEGSSTHLLYGRTSTKVDKCYLHYFSINVLFQWTENRNAQFESDKEMCESKTEL